ncbi:hypothetical protein EDD86DRAFT_174618, partial [Gorgonomyces haynaldii]
MLRNLSNQWKMLRLPWRSTQFRGRDLEGNMYFETPRPGMRPRRHIEYLDGNPYNEYHPNSIPVQWMAWLRHTREDAPPLDELQLDQVRLQQLKVKVDELQEKE